MPGTRAGVELEPFDGSSKGDGDNPLSLIWVVQLRRQFLECTVLILTDTDILPVS